MADATHKVSPIAIQKALKGISYPTTKADLLKQAQSNNAPDDVIEKIKEIPGDQFPSTKDVMKALGQTE
jgi:hypothetical protein